MKYYIAEFRNYPYAFTTSREMYRLFKQTRGSNEFRFIKGDVDDELEAGIIFSRLSVCKLEFIPVRSTDGSHTIVGTAYENFVLSETLAEMEIWFSNNYRLFAVLSDELRKKIPAKIDIYQSIDELRLFIDLFRGTFFTDREWNEPLRNGESYLKILLKGERSYETTS